MKLEKKGIKRIFLFISLIFTFIFLAFMIKAQFPGCCLKTIPEDGVVRYCVDYTYREYCQPGNFFTGKLCKDVERPIYVEESGLKIGKPCDIGVCLSGDGYCQSGKLKVECLSTGGKWFNQEKEKVDQCKEGCCMIAGNIILRTTKERCKKLTLQYNYDLEKDMVFKESEMSDWECRAQGAGKFDQGCCILGAGNCVFTSREDCINRKSLTFEKNVFCRDIKECAVQSHDRISCGLRPGDENKIVWLDSEGNQEEIIFDCKANDDAICSKCKEKECLDIRNYNEIPKDPKFGVLRNFRGKAIIKTGYPYCKSTRCNIGKIQDQYWDNKTKKRSLRTRDINLISGTSVCYNLLWDYPYSNKENKVFEKLTQERTTGLQSSIIHCAQGDIVVEGLGVDRKLICDDNYGKNNEITYNAAGFENNWSDCINCGTTTGFFGSFRNAAGDLMHPFVPAGTTFAYLILRSKQCTKQECEAIGDCVYSESDMKGLFWNRAMHSCDPIYPPGSSGNETVMLCSLCGEGGDWIWNLCTRAECESKGNCMFTQPSLHRWIGGTIVGVMMACAQKANLGLTLKGLCLIPWFSEACQWKNPDCVIDKCLTAYEKCIKKTKESEECDTSKCGEICRPLQETKRGDYYYRKCIERCEKSCGKVEESCKEKLDKCINGCEKSKYMDEAVWKPITGLIEWLSIGKIYGIK